MVSEEELSLMKRCARAVGEHASVELLEAPDGTHAARTRVGRGLVITANGTTRQAALTELLRQIKARKR